MLNLGRVLVAVGGILTGIVSIGLTFFSVLFEADSAGGSAEIALSVVSVVAGLVGGVATALGRAWGAALVAVGWGAMAAVFVLWGPSSSTFGLVLALATVLAIAVAIGLRRGNSLEAPKP